MVDPADGLPVVSAVYRKEELFHGPYLAWAPDLTVIMRDLAYITRQGYEFAPTPDALFALPHTHESGSHREMGVVIAAGPSFRVRGRVAAPLNLIDIAPTVLHIQGCAVPASMDGRVAREWLTQGAQGLAAQAGATEAVGPEDAPPAPVWTEQDEAMILRQLRNLGYVE